MTPKVMILDEPTRGIDVGAKAEIYRLMRRTGRRRRRDLDDQQRHGRSSARQRPRRRDARRPNHRRAGPRRLHRTKHHATRRRQNRSRRPTRRGRLTPHTQTLRHLDLDHPSPMKKELGLFGFLVLLVLVVVGVQIVRNFKTALHSRTQNPQFISANNLSNTANIIGQYGVFSIGLGLVIITGGIDLSVGSMLALIGVLLAMALTEWHWPWPLARPLLIGLPMLLGFGAWLAHHALESAAVYRHAVRVADLSRHRPLHRRRQHRRLPRRRKYRCAAISGRWSTVSNRSMPPPAEKWRGHADAVCHSDRRRGHRLVRAASLRLRPLPVRRRPQRTSRPLLRHQHPPRHRQRLCHRRIAHGHCRHH